MLCKIVKEKKICNPSELHPSVTSYNYYGDAQEKINLLPHKEIAINQIPLFSVATVCICTNKWNGARRLP